MKNADPTGTATERGTGVEDAAKAFETMLAPPQEDKPEGTEDQQGAEAETDGEPTEGEQEVDAEASGSEDEESGEEAAESDEQSEGEEEQEEQSHEPTFTVRVDGKEVQVSQSELIAGYSRTSDYTQKTQKLAEARKALQAQADAAAAERAEYGKLLPKLREHLEAGMGDEPNWAELKAQDPQKYLLARAEWDDRRRKIDGVRAQERLVAQREAREREAQIEQIAVEQHNMLLERLQSWRDPKVAEKEGNLIIDALQAVGFSGDELKIFDHRAILIARKAALWDQSQAQLKAAKDKVVKQKVPVAKPGAARRPQTLTERQKADRNRLAKTGKVEDAANVFKQFL